MGAKLVIEIEEGAPKRIAPELLSGGRDVKILRTGMLELTPVIDEVGHLAYDLRAKGYIGQIRIGTDEFVRVSPKVSVRNLFGMLEVAYHLKSFKFGEGIVDVDALNELYEQLVWIFCRRVLDRLRKGLYRGYIDQAEATTYVRGRLAIESSARLLAAGASAVYCEFQEHTSDLPDNQIIAWTVDSLGRASLSRDDVRSLVRLTHRSLAGAATLRPVKSEECIRRLYNRLNDDYQPLHSLCRFFLDSMGPGVNDGERAIMPYTVDMSRLFESFVAEWLRAKGPREYHFGIQHQLKLTGSEPITWDVDILVKNRADDRPIAILDTKYKRSRQSQPADIQQVVAYAVEISCTKSISSLPNL